MVYSRRGRGEYSNVLSGFNLINGRRVLGTIS